MSLGLAAMVATTATGGAQATVKLLQNIAPYAGTGTAGETGANGPATAAKITSPTGLGFDGRGNVYFSDYNGGNVIHQVNNLGIITTVAGGGANPATCAGSTNAIGDGCIATQATLSNPYAIAVDRAGNIFIADQGNNRIREVSAVSKIITTIIGTGAAVAPGNEFHSATPTAATTVNIYAPDGIAIDGNDNVFFPDSADGVVYKYFSAGANAGQVEAYVGASGIANFYGDGGQSYNAGLSNPIGLATDQLGNLYIADQGDNRIRLVTASTGVITTVAGNGTAGYAGDNGTAANAEFSGPRSISIDYAGDLIISDSQNLVLRIVYAGANGQVTTGSYVETLAGSGAACTTPASGTCGDGGLAVNAQFAANPAGAGGSTQFGFSPPNGAFYVADIADNRIRTLKPSTIFPAVQVGAVGIASQLGFQIVGGAATVSSVTIAPGPNNFQEFTVGAITSQPANTAEGTPSLTCSTNGTTSNAAGTICNVSVTFTPAYPGVRTAQFKVVTSAGTFYYGVSGIGLAPQAVLSPGTISTIAGTGTAGFNTTTVATAAQLNETAYPAIDSQGNLYFPDINNNIIRKITPAGVISTVAGAGPGCAAATAPCGDGGLATAAQLLDPFGVALDSIGNLYIADTNDNRIRMVAAGTGIITTIAGTGTAAYNGDGLLAVNTNLYKPQSVSVDANNNLYIADTYNNVIRVINSGSQYMFVYAGVNATPCATSTAACGDGGPAAAANFNKPVGIATDQSGNVLISDSGDNRIRKVTVATGVISTLAGTGAAGNVNATPATAGTLNSPADLAVDPAGNLYIADLFNNQIRRVDFATGALITIAGAGGGCPNAANGPPSCGDGGLSDAATFNLPAGIALDGPGNLYISDLGDNEVRKINVSSANLPFATTPVYSTSTDSPKTEFLQNIGNAPLTFNVPATGTNPSISTGFTEGGTQTCQQLSSGSTPTPLAAGAKCSYLISFMPTVVGSYTGSLVQTDNSLNALAATQTIGLTGTAVLIPATAGDTLIGTGVYGAPTSPITVTIPYSAPVSPTGLITVNGPGGTTLAIQAATCTAANQMLTCTGAFPSITLPAGPNTLTVTQAADNNYAGSSGSGTLTLNKASGANDTLTTSNATPNVNTPVTLTFTVPTIAGASAPATGTVTFTDTTTGTTLGTGTLSTTGGITTATLTTSAIPIGTNTITGTYGGNTNYAAANPAPTATVTPAKASGANDTLATSNAAPVFGNPVTLTFTVPPVTGETATPTGTVTFTDTTTGAVLGTGALSTVGGVTTATLTTAAIPAGANTITGTYGGDGNYAAANPAPTTTVTPTKAPGANDTLTTSNAAPALGTSVALTFTVPTTAGAPPPTGTVTFTDTTTGTVLGTGALSTTAGVTTATLNTSSIPAGANTITGTYGGNANYSAANPAPTTTVTPTKAPGANDTLATSNATPALGTPVTLTFTVPTVAGAPAPATGTVTFTDTTTGTTLGTGTLSTTGGVTTATLQTAAIPAGANTITGTYGGDANYSAANPAPTTTVTPAKAPGANDTLTTSNATPALGAPVTLTFTVPTVAGAPAPASGTVTFTDTTTGTVLGTGTLSTTGGVTTATLQTSSIPAGANTITGTYGGDANYSAANPAPTTTVTPTKAPGANDTLTTSNATPALGAPVTLTFTVPTVAGAPAPASGTVTFTDTTTGTVLGTGTLSTTGGVTTATLQTAAIPAGANTITGTYGGDANYAAANPAPTTTITPAKAPGTNDTLTTSNATPIFGTPVTLTFTVPTVAGVPTPTGAVTFTDTTTGTSLGMGSLSTAGGVTTATLTTSSIPSGANTITGAYPGDTNYAAANPTTTVTPSAATTPNSLTGSPATGDIYGQAVTLTEAIAPINGVCPAGPVTFANGGNSLGTGAIAITGGNCVATLMTTALPVGTDSLTASTPASNGFAAINSPLSYTVGKSPSTNDTLTANPTSTTFGSPVTLTFTVPPVTGLATPTGTVTFTSGGVTLGTGTVGTNGVATLTTTNIPVGSPSSVVATYSGDNSYAAGAPTTPVTVVAAGGDTVSASPSPSTVGSPVTITFTVPLQNGVAPSGSVTCSSGSLSLGMATVTSGTTTLSTTALPVSQTPPGYDPISCSYTGGGPYAAATPTATAVINKVASGGDTLTPNPATTTFGSSVTLTFTVPPAVNVAAPTGTVTFSSGGVTLGTGAVGTNGVATLTTSALPQGTDTVTGTYPGDTNYAPGAPTATVTVSAASSTSALTATPATGDTYGMPVTLTETVAPINGMCPAGPATFSNGTAPLGTGAVALTGGSCVATFTTSNLPVGTDNLTATIPASNGFGAISSPLSFTVGKSPSTSDTLTANPTSATFGSPVTLTFTVPPVTGFAAPTGTVTFTSGGVTLGTGSVGTNGVATLTTSALPAGTDTVTATYTGDNNYAAGAPTATVTVTSAPGTSALTASPATGDTYGTPVTLTETIAPINGVCPTGPATFSNGATPLGTGAIALTGGSCVATYTTSSLPVGTDNLTATVPASNGFSAINSPLTFTVGQVPAAGDTLKANPTSTTFGSPTTLTFTVSPIAGQTAPTGTVTFTSGGVTLGTGSVGTNGVATLNTSTLPQGTDTVTANYTGDTIYAPGAPTATVTVASASGSSALTATPATGDTYGNPVTLTETIAPINGACPAGPAMFSNGATPLGTGVIALTGGSCVATYTTSNLPVGTDNLTATVPASNGFGAISSPLVYMVGQVPATNDTLKANPTSTTFGTPVTLTFTVPPVTGFATPTGTVTFTSGGVTLGTGTVGTNGVATLTTSALPAGTDTVTANYTGDTNYAPGTPTAVVNVSTAGGSTITAQPNPTTIGMPVTITFTVPTVGGTPATGTVTCSSGTTQLGTGTLNGSGVATVTTTVLPVGSDPITCSYPGGGGYAAANPTTTATINQAPSTGDTLTANPTSTTFGTPVTLTFTVQPAANAPAPTGTVTFTSGGVTLGTGAVGTNGVATLVTSALPVGTDTVTANYPGDTNYAPGAPTATVTVAAAGGSTVTVQPNPTTIGMPVTITFTVPTVGGTPATGTVTCSSGTMQLGTGMLSGGIATITTTSLPVGSDPITCTYPGGNGYAPANPTATATITQAPSSGDMLKANPTSTTFGTPVTLTFTVPPVANAPVPTGTVTFTSGGVTLGTGTVGANGVATLVTSALPVGTDTVTATYQGDTNYAPGAPTATVTVTGAGGSTVTAQPNPTTIGTPVTITFTIPTVNGTPATGTVTCSSGTTQLGSGTLNSSGTVTITTTSLPVGSDPITCTYPGGGGYAPANPTTTATINMAPSTGDTLTANPTSTMFGSPTTLTFTVPPAANAPVPTGTVTFTSGGVTLGTGTVGASGVATLVTSVLPVGNDTVTATYPGDANYAPGAPTAVVTVSNATPTDTVTVTPPNTTYGTPVMITFTVPTVNGTPATGTVTCSIGTTPIGTGTLNGTGTVTITTTTLPVGTDPIVCTYPGNPNYGPASVPTTVTIARAPTVDTLTSNLPAPTVGTPVTLTYTVPVVNGVPATGTVTFTVGGVTLGTGTLVNGVATLTTTALPSGTVTVIGTYAGNGTYAPGTATTILTVTPLDFAISATPPLITVNPGDTAIYTVSLTGVPTAFPFPVTLTATGLPAGATVAFANGTYVPGVGPTSTTMTIVTSPLHSQTVPRNGASNIYYGLLLLPLLGVRRIRRKLKTLPRGVLYGLTALLLISGVGAMTGCAGGYFGPNPNTYTITVTGTSGTLVHSTSVTLTIR